MTDYREFQQLLRTAGRYETPPKNRPSRPTRVSSINSVRYAFTILSIVSRCASRNVRGTFDYDSWAEICSSSISFAEKMGATVTFEGFEQRAAYAGPVVYVSNHMSTLETMVFPTSLTAFGKLAIILKQSLEDIPFVGAAARAVGSIAVSRKNAREDLVTVLEQGSLRLAGGSSVLLFPQGTRQAIFEAKRFNTLGAKLAERAKVPVVPIAVRTDFLQTGKWVKDFGRVDPSKPIRFSCGPVIPTDQGAKKAHEQSVAFIEGKIREWGMPVAASCT
jgi:1-acyl-sn-glycerol-3-phosphate acyltransferase